MARPWIVGSNPAEPIGSSVSDGYAGRVSDPLTGAGVFNPNLDPAVVGIDPLTGSLAPSGTDMSFGSAIRRQMHTNVINGDFAVLPPGGVDSLIDSDPTSATYNPLPGWVWVPPADGSQDVKLSDDSGYGGGHILMISASGSGSGSGALSQLVAIPISQGKQYRVLISAYGTAGFGYSLAYQFFKIDTTTAVGSKITTAFVDYETKVDAGLVPASAAYVRLELIKDSSPTTGVAIGEVRCAFPPAEASLGLGSITAASGNIDSVTGETVVKAITIPAYTFVVGSVYRITAWATVTSTVANAVTVRVRVGPTTLAGAIVTSTNPTATTTASNDSVRFEAAFTVRSEGLAGTVSGAISFVANESQPFTNGHRAGVDTGTTTIDTTVANLIELTAVTAGGNTDINFRQAYIECVMAS